MQIRIYHAFSSIKRQKYRNGSLEHIKENDVSVNLGQRKNVHGEFSFVKEGKDRIVLLDDGQLSRLHAVTDGLQKMLPNADYALSISMENLPGTKTNAGYAKTGINWIHRTTRTVNKVMAKSG